MTTKKWAVVPHENFMTDDGEYPIQIIDGEGNTVACNTSFYPTPISQEHAATIVAAVNGQAELRELLEIARAEIEELSAEVRHMDSVIDQYAESQFGP